MRRVSKKLFKYVTCQKQTPPNKMNWKKNHIMKFL